MHISQARKFVFRTDASLALGTGHVMRCLTLGSSLRERGAEVVFVCREHEGHLCDLIEEQRFVTRRLPAGATGPEAGAPAGEAWLGVPWQADAEQTCAAIGGTGRKPGWLVVDHYAIDQRWERILRPSVGRILAIDDLADRPHDCDLLLDQNFDNPLHARYFQLLPPGTRQLLGTTYALVRPEFLERRESALRRRDGQLRRLLVSMGGTDAENETAKVLAGLAMRSHNEAAIDVVIGQSNPHREEVRKLCDRLPGSALYIQTPDMAELMTRADLAIGGGGSSTWERCVLGLPAIVAIQSENQAAIAEAVHRIGGHHLLGWSRDVTAEDYILALGGLTASSLLAMSRTSAGLCDGRGTDRVVAQLMDPGEWV